MGKRLTRLLGLIAFMAAMGTAHAQTGLGVAYGPSQPNDCVSQAATYHAVNSWVLRAILQVESGFNPKAINKNRNGTVDVGIAQMNSMHFKELRKYGVAPDDLMDACLATYVAAWHLRKQLSAHGNTWFAVGAYHSATPCFNRRYVSLVWNVLLKWGVVAGQKESVPTMEACAPQNYAGNKPRKGSDTTTASILALD